MRQLSVEMPESIVDIVARRSAINGRWRSAEFRYLVELGLTYAEDGDPRIDVPPRGAERWVNVSMSLTPSIEEALVLRSQVYHRPLGREFLRMTIHALEETARRDLEVIEAMMSRQGSEQPSAR